MMALASARKQVPAANSQQRMMRWHERDDPKSNLPSTNALLRARGDRPCRRAAKRGYELPSRDTDCHLPAPERDHARCNIGKNITP